jgi:hypothetical protein
MPLFDYAIALEQQINSFDSDCRSQLIADFPHLCQSLMIDPSTA